MCVRICLVFNLRSIDPIFEYFSDFVLNCNNLFADLLNKHIHTFFIVYINFVTKMDFSLNVFQFAKFFLYKK